MLHYYTIGLMNMKAFPGFHTISRIYQSTTTSVFKCRRLSDNLSVMIKTLNQEFPSNEKLDGFRHEYEIGRQLNFDGIIEMYSLEPLENSLFLVMEDFDAVSLQSLIAQNQMSLDYGLHIAKRLCTILEKIHDKSIIHKDLNPSNILVNPQSDTIKIIDFAFATELSRQNKINPTDKIQGTLSYIAPEQTGRMDRSVDYRSDYYSFGITLYEMITGRLPFVTQDPLRLIHCHIAKLPLSPHNLNLDIPGPVSSIVMKMIAKNPEERYQSIHGIRADLKTCLNQLKTTGNISDFKIGQHDIPHHFLISQKMYARNAEMDQLIAICNRIFSCHSHDQTSPVDSRQSEVVMIKGETGIGKTVFVDNYKDYILKNCPHEQVFFISGKIDQLSRNTPYSALVSAFSELIRHLLKMPESQLKQWRKKLQTALGDNGQLIVNVIPEIEWIIGEQPAIHNLSPTELQNRFEYVFQNFIMTFAAFDNPLIIFMDDLQWIDQASLKLIQLIVTNNDSVLLLIGAYRSSKLSDDHVLFRTIRSIEKQSIPVTTITLQPLSQTHINQFLCDTFNCESDYARVLTDIIVDKTQGNPFFMNELIASIHENKLIQLTQEGWKWDVQSIQELEITDNIALLMRKRLKRLSGSTLLFIQAAACIGIDFSKDMVTHILSDEEVNSDECIVEAMHANIIKECQQTLTDYDACTLTAYRFDDDHLRQTAFELIPENKRLLFHKKIGHYLLQISPGNQRKARIFSIVNHLNASVSLCDTPDEKIQLANLNHEAGLRAKSATAYEAAFSYFLAGVQLLNQNNWNDLYSLTFSLYIEAAEAAYLTGNFEEMLRLSEEVLSNTNQLMDQVKVYEIQLQACKMQDKKLEAIEIGQKVLAMLGVSIPKQSSKISTAIAIIRIYLGISGKRIDTLIDLPEMTDPKQLVITRILTYVGTAYYITSPEILPIIITEQIQLFTKYGNTPASSATYAAYGMLLCGMLNDLDNGYRYGRLAMSLLDRYKTKEYWSKTLFRVGSFILHWKEHIRNTLPLFEEAFKYGIEMGDIEFSVFARYVGGIYSFLAGVELTTINKDINRSLDKTQEFKHLTAQYYKNLLRQLLTNLSSANETPWIFSGEYYQEETTLPSHIESQDRTITAMVHYSKGYINYLFGRFDDALICMENIKPYFKGLVSTFLIPCYYYFDTLIRLARYESLSRNEQKEQMKIISSHHKRISQWAKHAPMNHMHRFHLIQAEIYRVQNEKYLAMNHYDKAIHFAHEHQFLNDEALSNELTAKFYMQQSKKSM
ncbi:MAG: multi-sensor signal transduction multi-kinase [Candidatus Magnetoglobus multicellularis str. Araruama]|uniref:Multi-sensor signal transduction multi-kinase n=1 Tax=Candidatus Magnetoglobus multicellularis str. Araruama TaxID=890399 RepID=A0A1V1P7N2_9BACT|nr:MAG: multi-sensor signal transduction multi-kinase [Candidatus Magnetoglobus multicellularis str. Araruama]